MKTAYILPALICILFHEIALKGDTEVQNSLECTIKMVKEKPSESIEHIDYQCVEVDYTICSDSFSNPLHFSETC